MCRSAAPSDKIEILGSDVADLIDTIDHNIEHGDTDPRFQRKVMYRNVPVAVLPEFRKLSGTQAQALLETARQVAGRAATCRTHPINRTLPRARVGMGIFYFEEQLESDAPKEK